MEERPKQSPGAESSGAGEDAPNGDLVFAEEQAHLSHIYAELVRMADNLADKMRRADEQAAADKLSMSEELAPNFATYADAMETYADFATMNRVIDAYNASQHVDAEKLSSLRLLLRQPYFAKVALRFKPNAEPKELYIGTAGMSDDSCRRMVVDWRSPVAEVYYNQDNGPTSYQANGRTINVDLTLRRQFDIVADKLRAYFDTTVAIQDALLLTSLSQQRTAQMKAITATIQREQNLVVRHEDTPALLVSGIAGSGKTSVLLQRIAYLFYRKRDELDPSEVFLITPNPVFGHYIENVLPDLGERNPEILTWEKFARQLLPSGQSALKTDAAPEKLARIDEAMTTFAFDEGDFREVRDNGVRFFSVAQIRACMAKFKNIPAGPHLVTLVREELEKRLEGKLAQMSRTDDAQDAVSALDPDEQLSLFGEVIDPQDEQEAARYALRYLNHLHGHAFEAIANDEWLRIDRIGMRLLKDPSLEPMTWLYLKMALTGMGNAHAKYVMIDEVQDYTEAQLLVLARYFKRASFLLLGDENQAITEKTATFDQIRAVFRKARGTVDECQLLTSYRSTPEITALFARLLDQDARMSISSVQRSQMPPSLRKCESDDERDRVLRAIVDDELERSLEHGGLCAVIAPHKGEAKRLHNLLIDVCTGERRNGETGAGAGESASDAGDNDSAGERIGRSANDSVSNTGDSASESMGRSAGNASDITSSSTNSGVSDDGSNDSADESTSVRACLIGKGDELPASGVVVIPLSLAKGLEFDHVIIPDASERAFPSDGGRVVRNRLYTTLSRATQKITILSKGPLTKLLGHADD